jgi:hypothetical protein
MIPTYQNELPAALKQNDNLLFHGSSNISEQALDVGQTINYSFIKKEAIEALINVYDAINWKGFHGGGYAVLNSFSNTDWTVDGKRGFFLGEPLERCKLYASKDFAGGELIRSIWYSLLDLHHYIVDENIREEHKKYVELNYVYTRKSYDVNLEKLRLEIANFDSFFNEITTLRDNYKYGVIYCYEFKFEDYKFLEHRGGMGIIADQEAITDRLICKVLITEDDGLDFSDTTSARRTLWSKRLRK